MKRHTSKYYCFLLFLLLAFASCRPTKSLVDGQYLLNKVIIKNQIKDIDKENLLPFLKQRPNSRLLGLWRNRLFFYNVGYSIKRPKLKKSLMNSGEAPVILDSLLTEKSRKQLELYTHNKGYFNSIVRDSVVITGKKKVSVYYSLTSSVPYTIRNISYVISDPKIDQIVRRDTKPLTLVKTGERYDVDVLQQERDRITKDLRNRGFYNFVKEYIYFQIDSNLNNHQVDIVFGIKNRQTLDGEQMHERYYINGIYIQTDYNFRNNSVTDTLKYTDYYFLTHSKLKYKPKALSQQVFYKKDDLFKIDRLTLTYNRLSNLNVFKSVNIRFEDSPSDSLGNKQLNCFIELTPAPTNSFTIEMEGTHNTINGNGVAGSIVYKNKNLFHGAEIFQFKLKGAMQIQKTLTDEQSTSDQTFLSIFNTLELGPEVTLSFPKFLFFGNSEKFSKSFNPKTALTASVTFQKRVDYTRQMANLSLSYNWKESVFKTHIITFPNFSYLLIDPNSPILQDNAVVNDILLKSQYSDQFITGAKYSFIFNNQHLNQQRDFMYFRGNLELAGNALRLMSNLVKSEPNQYNQFQLLGINYAQFILPDIEFKYYKIFSQFNSLVGRISMGVGIPYKNSYALPFVKSFTPGGTNDIRAWEAYSLGPGSYHSDEQKTQVGDVKLEANIEGRFDIYKYLEGALFIDAGNVWLMHEDILRPGGNFMFKGSNNFINQIAIGAGIGFRFDFSFFILRFDMGLPLRTPYLPDGQKWIWYAVKHTKGYTDEFGVYIDGGVWKNEVLDRINFNLGIGYPF